MVKSVHEIQSTDLSNIKHIPPNHHGEDWVVGDIHGMYDLLMRNLWEVGFNFDTDRLFAVGDLIDRGPQSAECILLLGAPWFYSVLGNHEFMMLNRDYTVWINNGGKWWIDRTQFEKTALTNMVRTHCPIAFEIEHVSGKKVGIVHAEPPHVNWALIDWTNWYQQEVALWARTMYNTAKHKQRYNVAHPYTPKPVTEIQNIDLVIMGHSPSDEVIVDGNMHWIDTGACWSDGFFTIQKISEMINV